jgi:hypothetical protein
MIIRCTHIILCSYSVSTRHYVPRIYCAHYSACSLAIARYLGVFNIIVFTIRSAHVLTLCSCIRSAQTLAVFIAIHLIALFGLLVRSCLTLVALMLETSVHAQSRVCDVWDL